MKKTRCKFVVSRVSHHGYSGMPASALPQESVTLMAVSGSSGSAEDVSFSSATPQGTLEITITNPAIVGTFRPGSHYYLDLITIEE